MKNRKKIIFLFFLISLIFYSNDVFAKEVKKRCKYDYYTNVSDKGNLFSDTGYEGNVIELIIYDDNSQDTSGDPAGDEDIQNWGKDYKKGGKVLLDAVPKGECPNYIIVADANLYSALFGGLNYFGLNISSDKLVSKCTELANSSLAPYNQVSVFKNQDIDEEEEETILYKCEYDNYTITVDLTNKKLLISNALAGLNVNYEISDELYRNWFSEERGTDECLPTVSCTAKVGTVVTYKIFNDSMEAKEAGYDSCSVKVCAGDDCDSSEYSCMTYNKYITQLDSLYAQAQANSTGNTYSEINKLEAKLASLCKGVMNSYTYEENCVKACVHFESDLAKIKITYGAGIGDGGGSASCSLSKRIVGWIFKIVKWMRYLVPILLILLSVLDFIKAIASDSEDEMRKVGAKFVKRLIVAAIIFLLPLMLEFLLGIFNIDTYDYCLK